MHDHKTGHCGLGSGIICGLETSVLTNCALRISVGYGRTSRGHCLNFSGGDYKFYQKYGKEIAGLSASVKLYELLKDSTEDTPDALPIPPQAIDEEAFVHEKVALLYLSGSEKEPLPLLVAREELMAVLIACGRIDPSCSPGPGPEADDVELLSYPDQEDWTGADTYQLSRPVLRLQPISPLRFGFAHSGKDCKEGQRFFCLPADGKTNYAAFLTEYELLIEDGLSQLESALADLRTYAKGYFTSRQEDYVDFAFQYLFNRRWPELKEKNVENRIVQWQYVYAFIQDLYQAHAELVAELQAFDYDCPGQNHCLPDVLLLGETGAEVNFGLNSFRDHYRRPPTGAAEQEQLEKIRFLHWRMAMLIKCFYLPGYEAEDTANYHYTRLKKYAQIPVVVASVGDIKALEFRLTPDRTQGVSLGERTIPFYYYTGDEPGSIHHFWSFAAKRNGRLQWLRSYHSGREESYADLCRTRRPLTYALTDFPSLRIEGILNKEKMVVEDNLAKDRDNFGLPLTWEEVPLGRFLSKVGDCFRLAEAYQGATDFTNWQPGWKIILVTKGELVIGLFYLPCCQGVATTLPKETENGPDKDLDQEPDSEPIEEPPPSARDKCLGMDRTQLLKSINYEVTEPSYNEMMVSREANCERLRDQLEETLINPDYRSSNYWDKIKNLTVAITKVRDRGWIDPVPEMRQISKIYNALPLEAQAKLRPLVLEVTAAYVMDSALFTTAENLEIREQTFQEIALALPQAEIEEIVGSLNLPEENNDFKVARFKAKRAKYPGAVATISGIGEATMKKLNAMGVFSAETLAKTESPTLRTAMEASGLSESASFNLDRLRRLAIDHSSNLSDG